MSQRRPWKQWSMNPCCVMYGEGGLAARCENEETAALIVREHNAHNDLLEALEKIIALQPYMATRVIEVCNLARAAIANSKEV